MSRAKKSWGFPRWGEYGVEQDPISLRMCDFDGCGEAGVHPAPKSPFSKEKWWFCPHHAAEFNRNWNFFEEMTDEEAAAFARGERRYAESFAQSDAWSWGGDTDESGLSRVERDAYDALDLEHDSSPSEVKGRYRDLAKRYHPDRNPGDGAAEHRFMRVTAAYELLKSRGRV